MNGEKMSENNVEVLKDALRQMDGGEALLAVGRELQRIERFSEGMAKQATRLRDEAVASSNELEAAYWLGERRCAMTILNFIRSGDTESPVEWGESE